MTPEPSSATAELTAAKPRAIHQRVLLAAGSTLCDAIVHHRWYVALVFSYLALAVIVGRATGNSAMVKIFFYSTQLALLFIAFSLAIILGHAVWMMVFVRPKGALTPAILSDFKGRFLQKKRIAGFAIVFLLNPLFFSAFTSFKRMIPYVNFWHWDATFRDWDKYLHFGRHPWEWTHAVFGNPLVTTGINFFYHAWLFVLLFTLLWQAANTKRPELRMQYFITFVLAWMLIGSLLGTTLSSAGPVYFSHVTGGSLDPFKPLMAKLYALHEVSPVWALELQETLWANYTSGRTNLRTGISAMPSMHVATAVHMALLGWRSNWWAGLGYTVFAVIIQIGSVHLGWHYAIDGYVSAAAVLVIWFAVGWIMRSSKRRPAPAAAT